MVVEVFVKGLGRLCLPASRQPMEEGEACFEHVTGTTVFSKYA